MESVKEVPQERLPERIEETIGDILVPPIVEENVQVVRSLPQDRLQQRTLDQVLVLPTVEETVESPQIVQDRVQQSIEEQIVDDPENVDSPVPQVVEEQLVAVAPTPATTDATFPHENFDELCTILKLNKAELHQAELMVQRLDLHAAISEQACDANLVSEARQAYEPNKVIIGIMQREHDAVRSTRI